uniref:Uncharacterized protein n=1 Tax=Glossina pallidipes TaxID=7398 RepID=A0A1B0AD09_GLOPL
MDISSSSNSGGKFSSEHSLRTICSHIRVLQSTSNSGTPKLTSSKVHSSVISDVLTSQLAIGSGFSNSSTEA